ncbi:hypothetical protein CTI12_AA028250 [Artemisia annua]|uniref:Uncharacterized protein n=1 Tax=Artemisia annua TaxID=35608 RepID=A0A2U1Q0L8_ARTAN|nr:hypothetical protein CTI12_AA028250 [Artemisia annua]
MSHIENTFAEHMDGAIETWKLDNEDGMWKTFYDNINEAVDVEACQIYEYTPHKKVNPLLKADGGVWAAYYVFINIVRRRVIVAEFSIISPNSSSDDSRSDDSRSDDDAGRHDYDHREDNIDDDEEEEGKQDGGEEYVLNRI